MMFTGLLFRCLGILVSGILIAESAYAFGPRDRVLPNRPNPPGPNNPIGPNNPAVSNPLSSLNPSTPFSNNQIVLRQLLQAKSQSALPSAASVSSLNVLYGYIPNASLLMTLHKYSIPANQQLLLTNRTVYSTSHPLIFQRPDPMTPLSNNYTVINGRYYAISHNPANDASLYSDSGATLFNGDQMIYLGLGQQLKFALERSLNSVDNKQRPKLGQSAVGVEFTLGQ